MVADEVRKLAERKTSSSAEQCTVASQTASSIVKIADMGEKNSVINQVADHVERASNMRIRGKMGLRASLLQRKTTND